MPEGRVVRFEENLGRGVIETATGRYMVLADDMEPRAQVQGAFVRFDVQRGQPHDRAVNVLLREGTRNAPTQRRFGDHD
jgi:trimethylamine:corrinoid methyltransferase-like protein